MPKEKKKLKFRVLNIRKTEKTEEVTSISFKPSDSLFEKWSSSSSRNAFKKIQDFIK